MPAFVKNLLYDVLTTSIQQLTEWASTRGSSILISSAHPLTQEVYNAAQILVKPK
jgi:hypothetical protein